LADLDPALAEAAPEAEAADPALRAGWERAVANACRALGLRAQAQAASNRGKAAEEDFARLVPLCPDWRPDGEAFPLQTLQRFERVHAARIGVVAVRCELPGFDLILDGRPAGQCPREVSLVAGEHRFAVHERDYEPAEAVATVVAGGRSEVALA